MRSSGSRPVAVVAVLVITVVLTHGVGADAKKRKSSNKRSSKSIARVPVPSPSFAAPPSPPAVDLGPMQQQMQKHIQQQVVSVKEQAQKIVDGYSSENKQIIEKHNNLVNQYNDLAKRHQDLIGKYNHMVDELADPSMANFLSAKAIRISKHPGIEGAMNKTKLHVLPAAERQLLNTATFSMELFNVTKASVQKFLEEYGGRDQEWVPAASGVIVYGAFVIPLAISCWCVLELVCKLQRLILFGHIYLAATGILLAGVAISTDADPLSTFAEQDPQLFQFAQAAFAIVFLAYSFISFFSYCCSDGDSSARRLVHIMFVMLFGTAYYMLVWTPAMLDELPKVDDFVESLVVPPPPSRTAGKTASDDVPVMVTAAPYCIMGLMFAILFMGEQDSDPKGKRVQPEDDLEWKGD